MMDPRLRRRLERLVRRRRHLRLIRRLACAWLVAAMALVILLVLNLATGWYAQQTVLFVAASSLAVGLLIVLFNLRANRDYRSLALQVELCYPDLDSSLVTAVEQEPMLTNNRFGFLQEAVIERALEHGYRNPWYAAVPRSRLVWAHGANLCALALLAAASLAFRQFAEPRIVVTDESKPEVVTVNVEDFQVTIEPGNDEVERGTSVPIVARFQGPVPADATLVYTTADGEATQLSMSKSLKDPLFGARITALNHDAKYQVHFGETQSDEYQLTVFEFPKLDRADITLSYPEYTGMNEKTVQDVRNVSAVEGTRLTIACHVNKSLAHAELVDRDGEKVTLNIAEDGSTVYVADMTLRQSKRFKLQLVDEDGRVNKFPEDFVFNALANQPPDLKFVQPVRDVRVSPLEELAVKSNVWDDFGVARVGLSYTFAGSKPREIVFDESIPAKQRKAFDELIAMEELNAEPDQLLAYHMWAEDTGPSGEIRRTASDMYFAEVRHFEEIFRQGQQAPGGSQAQQQQNQQGGGQNAQRAEQLGELQKQIINGTWKLIRREIDEDVSEDFVNDVDLLIESQGTALEQLQTLAAQLQDLQSQEHANAVSDQMLVSIEQLRRSKDDSSPEPLGDALVAQQAAYQGLLKLRARQFDVSRRDRQQSSQSSGASSRGGSNRSQQQLQQLELSNDENRYETQRMAQTQQQQEREAEARETRQVLNRLRELARRQNDLNERLKELQSALQQAETQQQRQEIERQLKRLREEQQQIMRDTDELANRMEQPENQQRMADSREQLQQTRDQLRQTSEALEQGMVSRAAASGTRAERQFQDIREEFRRQSASQFEETMRQMQRASRELTSREQELAERLTETVQRMEASPSLREDNAPGELSNEFMRQEQRLSDLLEQMQQTVEDAEQAEPLLAERLYEAFRETRQRNLNRAIESIRQSLDLGLMDDAVREEDIARQGLEQLQQNIDRAAEGVLGDETEALRRARDQLEQLASQLNQEIQRNQPESRQQNAGQPTQEDDLSVAQASFDQLIDAMQQAGGNGQQPNQQRPGQERPTSLARQRQQQQQQGQQQQGQQQQGQQQQGQRQQSPNQQGENQQNQNQQNSRRQGQNQQGESPSQGQQSGRQGQQPGQQAGQRQGRQGGEQQSESPQRQNQQGSGQRGQQPPNRGNRDSAGGPNGWGGSRTGPEDGPFDFGELFNHNDGIAPLTGDDFLEWSDRLRDVEEMVDDPELRAEAARIRDRARGFRIDVKRHSKEPNWDLVRLKVAEPLVELRDSVVEELLRRSDQKQRVRIDRDPIPPDYTEQVRRYFEQLGIGK